MSIGGHVVLWESQQDKEGVEVEARTPISLIVPIGCARWPALQSAVILGNF